MTTADIPPALSRRERRAALAAAARRRAPHSRRPSIRQGYQTNLWGMPTYYLLRSGLLEKRGLKFEEFGVPSGNLTMQQMVARQVDIGTYAGPSLILGHDKGGLVAIAQIEHVGKTASVMVRKDLGLTKIEQLKGLKIANQTGSSVGNIFVDQIAPAAGLKKGDYQEVRMDVNNMIAALCGQDRGRDGQRRALQRDRRGRRPRGEDHGLLGRRQDAGVHGGDAGFRREESRRGRGLSQGLARGRARLQGQPEQGRRRDLRRSTPRRATRMSQDTFRKALATVDVDPGFPRDLNPTCSEQAEILLKEKKIAAIPDWSKALRPDFMEKARAGRDAPQPVCRSRLAIRPDARQAA